MSNILIKQSEIILETKDKLSAVCHLTALLYENYERINWIGFYFYKNGKLVLGPFQGKVACTEIEIGKGVCGTAFKKRQLLNVADVHRFEGHIACDSASNSEIVVPLIFDNKIIGVLDVDSTEYRRFGYDDEELFQSIADQVSRKMIQ